MAGGTRKGRRGHWQADGVASGSRGRAPAFTSICEIEPLPVLGPCVSLTSANTFYPQQCFESGVTATNELMRAAERQGGSTRSRKPLPGGFQLQDWDPMTSLYASSHCATEQEDATDRCTASPSPWLCAAFGLRRSDVKDHSRHLSRRLSLFVLTRGACTLRGSFCNDHIFQSHTFIPAE